jgi:HlyD family secretion protein
MPELFRKTALERLSSPEQLDQLLQVTRPRTWLTLFTMLALLAGAVVWGIWGEVSTVVYGQGMLVREGGVHKLTAPAGGRLVQLRAREGNSIKKGQLIAEIAQPELEEQIKKARIDLQGAQRNLDILNEFETGELRFSLAALNQQIVNLQFEIETTETQIQNLAKRLDNQKILQKQGLITNNAVLDTENQYNSARSSLKSKKNQITQVKATIDQKKNAHLQNVAKAGQQIKDRQAELDALLNQQAQKTRLVAGISGRVISLDVAKDDIIEPGQTLLTLELDDQSGQKLIGLMYFPLGQGKRISQGFTARLAPAAIDSDEYGYLLAEVVSVSEFPVSRTHMMTHLENPELVERLLQQGPSLEVEVNLRQDGSTPSGYGWTSSKGPPLKLTSGTFCAAQVTTLTQPPVTLVVPLLRKYLLGVGG